jgi:ectoine hydroxylase-related dioxygenase (phytanoyl-CoA dioxygenase family)
MHGKNVSWHQDYSYWTRTSPSHHLSVWLPLDDVSEENGTLQVVPCSQNWPLLPTVELQGGDMDALKNHLSKEQREMFRPEPVILQAGHAEMHSDHLVHGSMPNNSDRPRRALIINYMSADTVSNDDSRPIMPGFPIVPRGDVIEGEGFPIVLDLS